MPIRVLVVDDSNFFQHRLKDMINEHPELKVVGIASNGREAIDKAAELKPDIITMDFEMPVMDGVTAIKHILANRYVPILMFSSLTYEGAKITLDALAAGALDFIPKDFAEVSRSADGLKKKLHERLLTLASSSNGQRGWTPLSATPKTTSTLETRTALPATAALRSMMHRSTEASSVEEERPRVAPTASALTKPAVATVSESTSSSSSSSDNYRLKTKPKLIVIGASTGGPVALADVLSAIPEHFSVPIVLVQHMPESFTKAFAERLNRQCHIRVREAVDGDQLEPGLALLAPGGKQLLLDKRGNSVKVLPDDDRVTYKPSLDITFASAANAYGDKLLGIVLTGMGSDGCKGAGLLKQAGGSLWSQDEASSVIYGMPMAVAKAGHTDKVLSLKEIGPRLVKEVM
jgi:two-component system chemotaxis response regulator CheB